MAEIPGVVFRLSNNIAAAKAYARGSTSIYDRFAIVTTASR